MDKYTEVIDELIKFRNERDWEQFHNPKDLALAVSIEANELLELFLWKNADEANTEKVKEELDKNCKVLRLNLSSAKNKYSDLSFQTTQAIRVLFKRFAFAPSFAAHFWV